MPIQKSLGPVGERIVLKQLAATSRTVFNHENKSLRDRPRWPLASKMQDCMVYTSNTIPRETSKGRDVIPGELSEESQTQETRLQLSVLLPDS